MHIPEHWPRKEVREQIRVAMRVMGIPEPACYVRVRPEYVGKYMVVHWGQSVIMPSMEGIFVWLMYSDLTTKDQKNNWHRYRDHQRHYMRTSLK